MHVVTFWLLGCTAFSQVVSRGFTRLGLQEPRPLLRLLLCCRAKILFLLQLLADHVPGIGLITSKRGVIITITELLCGPAPCTSL